MAPDVSDKPWSQIDENDYEDVVEYCTSCLINLNGRSPSDWTKDKCLLPITEPKKLGGGFNRDAIRAAAAALVEPKKLDISAAQRRNAAHRLVTIFNRILEEQPPESLERFAKSKK